MRRSGYLMILVSQFPNSHKILPRMLLGRCWPGGVQATHDVKFITTSPHNLGFPARRPRELAVALNRATLVWTGPPQSGIQRDFENRLGLACAHTGDDIMVASPAEALAEAKFLARRQGNQVFALEGLSASDYVRLCGTAGQQSRFAGYEQERCAKHGEVAAAWLADLEQNPGRGASTAGAEWPTNLTHGSVCSWRHRRLATMAEYWCSMGYHMHKDATTSSFGLCPLEPLLRSVPHPAQHLLLGNGLHLASQLAWMVYVVALDR